ncbi:MAG: SlyX protein [Polaromonas sp. 39-63-203]|jgi:SlyX protein|uniref:SlyX family protein n=1 Tax=Polaromonas sp. TaxID=1869339 RepID=UPI000BC670E5|nr:SlyX family protein [Polaromonas sp.]OYY54100.1 MAG: SlyX protein [Polaromonas sp. 35-63-240]OYZ01825.1 MAG: SlyX protein [Polaromonas sp. 28-63-22]OYZ85229.1 MAG: SlyX protein [Polaromonas sp. 24-62-144]OZB01173.1 MAG: SlyX protein [Polaromonas sp. 39-63-203]HQS32922.1 SlyX family protein [Polaromonas sp.]
MGPIAHIEHRLNELEIKASFTEDLLERLDEVIVRQQQQIDSLIRQITHLNQTTAKAETAELRSLTTDAPPHY